MVFFLLSDETFIKLRLAERPGNQLIPWDADLVPSDLGPGCRWRLERARGGGRTRENDRTDAPDGL